MVLFWSCKKRGEKKKKLSRIINRKSVWKSTSESQSWFRTKQIRDLTWMSRLFGGKLCKIMFIKRCEDKVDATQCCVTDEDALCNVRQASNSLEITAKD